MADPLTTAETYIATWNASDEQERSAKLTGWAEDARYVDPLMQGDGRDEIEVMIAKARAQFPGHSFALTGTPDGHGSYVRFSWVLAPEAGAQVARGTDVVRLDAAGRIAEVIGFLDGNPA